MKLYRPVGLYEMKKIFDLGLKCFPPRQTWQPILYVVENYEYAQKIAKDWNTKDKNSGFVGYILEFIVSDIYMGYRQHFGNFVR